MPASLIGITTNNWTVLDLQQLSEVKLMTLDQPQIQVTPLKTKFERPALSFELIAVVLGYMLWYL